MQVIMILLFLGCMLLYYNSNLKSSPRQIHNSYMHPSNNKGYTHQQGLAC